MHFPSSDSQRKTRNQVEPDVWMFLDILAREAGKGHNRPLSKLVRLHPFAHAGYDERAGLQILNPFLVLPSFHEFSVVSCIAVRDGYTGIPFDWRYHALNSNLQRAELAYCCTSGSQLAEFLKHTPKLHTFKLAYQTKWHGCGHDWDVHEVFAALGEHCGNSLTDLSITIDIQYGTLKGGVSSLKVSLLHIILFRDIYAVDGGVLRRVPIVC